VLDPRLTKSDQQFIFHFDRCRCAKAADGPSRKWGSMVHLIGVPQNKRYPMRLAGHCRTGPLTLTYRFSALCAYMLRLRSLKGHHGYQRKIQCGWLLHCLLVIKVPRVGSPMMGPFLVLYLYCHINQGTYEYSNTQH